MAFLVDLPAELLCRIASHLFLLESPYHHDKFKDDGFCDLRLSCRYVELKTRYIFDGAAFATRVVTLHAQSLSRLRDIANHPRFGKSIKRLAFSKAYHPVFDDKNLIPLPDGGGYRMHQHAEYGVIELPRHGTDGVYPNDHLTLRKRVQLGLESSFDTIMAHASNLKDVVIEGTFMASFWLNSPSRQEQLNEQAQRHHQMIMSGGMPTSDDESDIVDRENEDYDTDDVDDPSRIETFVYGDYLLYLVTVAAQRHGIRFSSLRSTNNMSSSIRARTFVELAPAFQGLQHLHIAFSASSADKLKRMDGSPLHAHEGDKTVAKTLGHALNTLRGLQSLRLSFDDIYYEEDRQIMIARSLHGLSGQFFEHLVSVDIFDASLDDHDLYDFLNQQRTILRRVSLQIITLVTLGHWRPIMSLMLQGMPLLTEVRCSGLQGGPEFYDTTEQSQQLSCDIRCLKREDVLRELEEELDYLARKLDSW